MRSLWQSFFYFSFYSSWLSSSCHLFYFSSFGVKTRLILWDLFGIQAQPPVVHLYLGPQCALWLTSDRSCHNHCHPCCVCLFYAPRMCWRMMRTLAMPTAPSLMKVGARPGWMHKEFYVEYVVENLLECHFLFCTITFILFSHCLVSVFLLSTFHQAGYYWKSSCSLSLSRVYLWVSCCTWNMCVWTSAADLPCVSKRCYVITVWFSLDLLFALHSKLLGTQNSCEMYKKSSSVSTRHSVVSAWETKCVKYSFLTIKY